MFNDPRWLWALPPLLAAAWALDAWASARRRAVGAALGRAETLGRVGGDAGRGRSTSRWLRLGALACLTLALAGPQWGVELVRTRSASRQVVVAVDVSLSMNTPDVAPSRLERAKSSLSLLLDQLRGARVGVVAFAGDAQVVCPLTTDVDAAKELLSALDVGAVPVPGTAIGTALRVSADLLDKFSGARSVVLLTDGEDHHSDPLGAARELAARGVTVYSVGIGTPEGEPIPVGSGGYKKDSHGATVISRLGQSTLAEIAQITGGRYYRSSPGEDEIADIATRLNAAASGRGPSGVATRWQNRFRWPLTAAFALLLAELLLGLLPPKQAAAALALAVLCAPGARAGMLSSPQRDAEADYAQGRYDDALALYGRASENAPDDPAPVFDAGDALYRLDRDTEAAGAFASVAVRRGVEPGLQADSFYNLGNALYRSDDYAHAADAYRRALALSPRDADARRNLVLAVLRQRQPPQKNKKNDKKQDKKNPPPPQPKKDKDKGGGGGNRPPPTPPRPQDQMSKDDAERVMRAVAEREKAAEKKAPPPTARYGNRPPPKGSTEEDW